jgi:effector-binding domain-containing protein
MVEHIKYNVLQKNNDVEIRKYPRMVVASTTNEKENAAFNLLFNYISGNNKSKQRISMTSPVITSKKIPMTSPVISKGKYMAFCLPQQYSLETAPTPNNPNVELEIIPERILAVLRFNGKANEDRIKKYSQRLKNKVNEDSLNVKDTILLFRYNSPFMPGFLRRNEVAIELKDSKN